MAATHLAATSNDTVGDKWEWLIWEFRTCGVICLEA
jgi:hypothetical protein